MSNDSVQVTTSNPFVEIPVIEDHLFEVRGGIAREFAVRKAECLDAGVAQVLRMGVEIGLEGDTAFLLEFAMHTSEALRQAAGEVA